MLPSLLTAGFFAFSVVFAGRATKLVGATRANFFRLLFALFCLAIYANLFGQKWTGNGLNFFLLSGAIGIGFGDLATFQALRFIGPRLAVLLVQCLCAPFAALIEWRWLGTTLTGTQLAGGGVILLGTALSLLPGIRLPGALRSMAIGGSLAASASLLQAVGAVLTRKANMINGAGGVAIDGMTAAYQRMCGALVIMCVIYFAVRVFAPQQSREVQATSSQRWRRAWPWVLANGSAGLVLGIACFQWALIETPAAIVLSIVALTPLLVIPIVWLLEKEHPTLLSIVGSCFAVVGVFILRA